MTASFDAVAELTKTFSLLFQKKNWMLAVPLLIGTLVAVAVVGLTFVLALGPSIAAAMYGGASGHMSPAAILPALLGFGGLLVLVGVLVAFGIGMFTYGWAYAAAAPMWGGGDPDISGGFNKAMAKLGPLLVFGIIAALVICLLGWTVIVPILIGLFCLYCLPYIMMGNESGTGAISASIKLSRENFGPTAMLFLGFIVVGVASGIINAVLGMIPLLGNIIGLAVGALVGAYATLASMRFYSLLTGSATAAPAAPTA